MKFVYLSACLLVHGLATELELGMRAELCCAVLCCAGLDWIGLGSVGLD